MMDGNDLVTEPSRKGIISQAWTRISQVYQGTLDRWTPHTKSRWVGSFVLLLLFMLRIFTKQKLGGLNCTPMIGYFTINDQVLVWNFVIVMKKSKYYKIRETGSSNAGTDLQLTLKELFK